MGKSKEKIMLFLKDNSLSLVTLLLFLVFLVGLAITGFYQYNGNNEEHHQNVVTFGKYLTSSHFQEALFENWESEFLQMWAFVLLTIFLRQKGSPESKRIGREKVNIQSKLSLSKSHRLRAIRELTYSHSLGLALLGLFIFSFIMHAISGAALFSEEEIAHGGQGLTALEYLRTSNFWFESFQNWQSEFLAVCALVVLSIFLREKGSKESKRIGEPNSATGGEYE